MVKSSINCNHAIPALTSNLTFEVKAGNITPILRLSSHWEVDFLRLLYNLTSFFNQRSCSLQVIEMNASLRFSDLEGKPIFYIKPFQNNHIK